MNILIKEECDEFHFVDSFSYFVFVEGTSYRPWHYDLSASETAGDTIATLLTGRKIWVFAPMGRASADLVKICGAMRSSKAIEEFLRYLGAMSRTLKKKLSWCEVGAGETIYMPYGYGHSVITLCEGRPACMVSVDARADPERVIAANNSANNFTAVGHRREYWGW